MPAILPRRGRIGSSEGCCHKHALKTLNVAVVEGPERVAVEIQHAPAGPGLVEQGQHDLRAIARVAGNVVITELAHVAYYEGPPEGEGLATGSAQTDR